MFPENLRKINNPPNKIFAKGNLNLLKTFGIAIIGSRNCTRYGEKMSFIFANDLCNYGITIISGMAVGIDSFAHKGALNAKGLTIAVIPSGFNHIYPEKNIRLYNDILENKGLVITEYQEDEEACSQKFRDRNRIVAGLSMGTLVVEGAINSGTNITVKFTKEQEKNIFCIPSNLDSVKSYVPNKLIKEGAFLVTDAKDIIDKYSNLDLNKKINLINENDVFSRKNSNKNILNIYQKSFILDEVKNEKNKVEKSKCNFKKSKSNIEKEKLKVNIKIQDKYRDIYDLIRKNNMIDINSMARSLNIDVQELNVKLIGMELENLIISLPGGNYKLSNFKK